MRKWVIGLVVTAVLGVVLTVGAVGGVFVRDTYANYQAMQQNVGLLMQVVGQNIQQGHLAALQPPAAAPAAPVKEAAPAAPAKDAPAKK